MFLLDRRPARGARSRRSLSTDDLRLHWRQRRRRLRTVLRITLDLARRSALFGPCLSESHHLRPSGKTIAIGPPGINGPEASLTGQKISAIDRFLDGLLEIQLSAERVLADIAVLAVAQYLHIVRAGGDVLRDTRIQSVGRIAAGEESRGVQ